MQQLLNLGFDDRYVGGADMAGGDVAFAIDDEGDGQAEDASVLIGELRGGARDRVVHFEFLLEGADGVIVVVHGEADELHGLRILVLHFDEVGNFFFAGLAPGGPEIEDDDFAALIGESKRVAGNVGEKKFRGKFG